MTPLLRAARTAQIVTIDVLSNHGSVLVLAPHPDDESLGCGAAIAALTHLGRQAQVIVVTDGGYSHPNSRSVSTEKLRQLRAKEVAHSVDILTSGQGPVPVMLGYPDKDAPHSDAQLEEAITRILRHMTPCTTAVWSTWGGDPHSDHERTARLAARLVARCPSLELWSYPIWGRFDPNVPNFCPESLVLFETGIWQSCKAEAIAAHVSQMTGFISDDPHGFRMTEAHQKHFLTSPEIFLREPA